MSDASYEEKARRFRELSQRGQSLKDTDPVAALEALREANALFPGVSGMEKWLEYLEAKIRIMEARQEQEAQRAEQAAAERAAAEQAAERAAEQAAAERAAAERAAADAQPAAEDTVKERVPATAESFQESAPTEKKAVVEEAPVAEEAPVEDQEAAPVVEEAAQEVSMDQIKAWVKEAEVAAKGGQKEQAIELFDQALAGLRASEGSLKIRLKLTERRIQLDPDADLMFEAAELWLQGGDAAKASKRLEGAIRKDRVHLPSLQLKVELAKQDGGNHQILSALMQLSDAYDKHQMFKEFDALQKEIRTIRENM